MLNHNRRQSNIYGGFFLQKKLLAKGGSLIRQKNLHRRL